MARIEITDEQIRAAQGGDAGAMWEIVDAFDPMLKSLVRSVAPRATREQTEDYLQDGRAVLLQLIHDYDSSVSSASLSSFVYRAVRRAIAEADVANSTPLTIDPTAAIRVKRALWEAGGNVDTAWETFRDANDRTRRMSREAFIAMVEALAGAESLDTRVSDKGGHDSHSDVTLADTIADPSADVTDPAERRDYARWLLTQLYPTQRYALAAFYGVNMTAVPDHQAAAYLGVKPARLRRIRTDGCASARRLAQTRTWVYGYAALAQAA